MASVDAAPGARASHAAAAGEAPSAADPLEQFGEQFGGGGGDGLGAARGQVSPGQAQNPAIGCLP